MSAGSGAEEKGPHCFVRCQERGVTAVEQTRSAWRQSDVGTLRRHKLAALRFPAAHLGVRMRPPLAWNWSPPGWWGSYIVPPYGLRNNRSRFASASAPSAQTPVDASPVPACRCLDASQRRTAMTRRGDWRKVGILPYPRMHSDCHAMPHSPHSAHLAPER